MNKSILASKINWVAIITIAVGALTAAQQLQLSEQNMGLVVGLIGALNFILRTYFTK